MQEEQFRQSTKCESLYHENMENCTKPKESNTINQITDKISKKFIDSTQIALQTKINKNCFTQLSSCKNNVNVNNFNFITYGKVLFPYNLDDFVS